MGPEGCRGLRDRRVRHDRHPLQRPVHAIRLASGPHVQGCVRSGEAGKGRARFGETGKGCARSGNEADGGDGQHPGSRDGPAPAAGRSRNRPGAGQGYGAVRHADARGDHRRYPARIGAPRLLRRRGRWSLWSQNGRCDPRFRAGRRPQAEHGAKRGAAAGHGALAGQADQGDAAVRRCRTSDAWLARRPPSIGRRRRSASSPCSARSPNTATARSGPVASSMRRRRLRSRNSNANASCRSPGRRRTALCANLPR